MLLGILTRRLLIRINQPRVCSAINITMKQTKLSSFFSMKPGTGGSEAVEKVDDSPVKRNGKHSEKELSSSPPATKSEAKGRKSDSKAKERKSEPKEKERKSEPKEKERKKSEPKEKERKKSEPKEKERKKSEPKEKERKKSEPKEKERKSEPKGKERKSEPQEKERKSEAKGRKRVIVYSDSDDDAASSPVKSSPKKSILESSPEKSPAKSKVELKSPPTSPTKSPSKSPQKAVTKKSSPKTLKKALHSVKEGRISKSKSSKNSKTSAKVKEAAAKAVKREESEDEEMEISDDEKSSKVTNGKSKSDGEKRASANGKKSESEEDEMDALEEEKSNGKKKVSRKTSKSREQKSESEEDEMDASEEEKSKTKKKGSRKTSKSRGKKSESEEDEMDASEEEKSEGKKKVSTKTSKTPDKKSEAKSPAAKKPEPAIKGWDTDYNPAKAKYHPIDDASWSRGQSVPYLALAITLKSIEETSSRLKNIEILSNFFRSVILLSPQDWRQCVYLCLNKLAPAYEGVELGIAETSLIKTISQSTGRSTQDIKKQLSEKDLGEIAESSRTSQRTLFQPSPLTVAVVFKKLEEIAKMTGTASQQKKISMIQSMLVACKYSEARFIIRSLAGKMRIGLAEQSLLQALAQACYLTPPNQNQTDSSIEWPPAEKMINKGQNRHPDKLKADIEEVAFKLKSCYCECPNYDILLDALLKDGIDGMEEHCQLTPGIPPRPMLAQPTKGVDDILQRFTDIKFTCEYKYDGERAQIHVLEDGSVQVYSRNQENNTLKYPDIVNRFKDCIGPNVTSCILDSEAVAWDREKETILPFQVLSTRKRKDANADEIKVQVILYGFDLIYLNGESLVKKPLIKRRELLRENFKVMPGQFEFAKSLDTDSMEQVQEFLEESIKGNCEGLMVKTLDVNASYELAKRSHKWLKLKKDYLNTGGDSLDLVVIGGFSGKGKRTGTYGAYLLACYDPDNEEFQTICKLGTGFSDEQLEEHTTTLKGHLINKPKPYYQFHSNLTPDEWFDAVVVWEVKCADLSLSPVHKAAAGLEDPERGISLRFPRFIRKRDDKNAEDATSSSQVALLYKNQEVVKNAQSGKTRDFEDDFY